MGGVIAAIALDRTQADSQAMADAGPLLLALSIMVYATVVVVFWVSDWIDEVRRDDT